MKSTIAYPFIMTMMTNLTSYLLNSITHLVKCLDTFGLCTILMTSQDLNGVSEKVSLEAIGRMNDGVSHFCDVRITYLSSLQSLRMVIHSYLLLLLLATSKRLTASSEVVMYRNNSSSAVEGCKKR